MNWSGPGRTNPQLGPGDMTLFPLPVTARKSNKLNQMPYSYQTASKQTQDTRHLGNGWVQPDSTYFYLCRTIVFVRLPIAPSTALVRAGHYPCSGMYMYACMYVYIYIYIYVTNVYKYKYTCTYIYIHPVIHGCWGNFILQPSLSADNSFATTDCVTNRSCQRVQHIYIYIYMSRAMAECNMNRMIRHAVGYNISL